MHVAHRSRRHRNWRHWPCQSSPYIFHCSLLQQPLSRNPPRRPQLHQQWRPAEASWNTCLQRGRGLGNHSIVAKFTSKSHQSYAFRGSCATRSSHTSSSNQEDIRSSMSKRRCGGTPEPRTSHLLPIRKTPSLDPSPEAASTISLLRTEIWSSCRSFASSSAKRRKRCSSPAIDTCCILCGEFRKF